MTQHLDEGRLQALLDGEIPSGELPPIQAHLAACAECRARFDEARDLAAEADQLIELLDGEVPAAPRRTDPVPVVPRRRWAGGLAWAATLLLAAGAGYWVRGLPTPAPAGFQTALQERTDRPQDTRAESVAQAPSTPVPAVTQPSALGRVGAGKAAPERGRAEPRADGPALAPQPLNVADARKPAAPSAVAAEAATSFRDSSPKDASDKKLDSLAKRRVADAEELKLEVRAATGTAEDAAKTARAKVTAQAAPPPAGALAATSALRGGAAGLREVAAIEVTLSEALRRLGGSLRLIEGLVPIRIEAAGNQVRVVYPLDSGELLLIQQLAGGKLTYTLQAPPGFPVDSLERLKARVRE